MRHSQLAVRERERELQQTPSHFSISGNDLADKLAAVADPIAIVEQPPQSLSA